MEKHHVKQIGDSRLYDVQTDLNPYLGGGRNKYVTKECLEDN